MTLRNLDLDKIILMGSLKTFDLMLLLKDLSDEKKDIMGFDGLKTMEARKESLIKMMQYYWTTCRT